MTYSEIATKVLEAIKSSILTKKKSKGNSFPACLEVWDTKSCGESYFTIKVDDREVARAESSYAMRRINDLIVQGLKDLKGTRGWGRLSYNTVDEYLDGYRSLYSTATKVPHDIVLLAEPCREFRSLANYVRKYAGTAVEGERIYSVTIGGKRGRVYGEEGDRRYLCHRPDRCKALLDELRRIRGANDRMTCAFAVRDDIDPWELQCSIRNETEFGGVRHNTLVVKCTTPGGKVKTLEIAD